jgi:uncharacterized membrane protein
MMPLIAIILLAFILAFCIWLTYRFRSMLKAKDDYGDKADHYSEKISNFQNYTYAVIILLIVGLLVCIYLLLKSSVWEAHLMEWMNIVVRVAHVTFGIAWIGASFYFVFLENALNRTENIRDELTGNLWAIHGGGFYYLEKYKIAPREIPKHLHWFKYEAYFTWLSGFALLFIVYYFNAEAMLIDKNVLNLSSVQAIAIGIGSFIIAWLIYHLLCKTALVKKGPLFAIIGLMIATAFAYFYSHVFNNRAAYIHFGAMIGTIMAANVFFIIIPSQKAMVKAARENKPLNPELGKHAGLRSLHNNYFTLPVLFVMVSNHFPSTFGNKYSWLILAIITLGSAGVKHWLNLRERGQLSVWVLPASVIILLAAALISAPQKPGACKSNISFTGINAIIQQRCTTCHSSKPTDDVYKAPPNGVVYDTPNDIVKMKDKIMQRVVVTKTMPQNNKTSMTPEERDLIRCWIEQGANLSQ